MEVTALVADQLYRFFHVGDDETRALRGVSLSVNVGEIVAVTGPSGSGKSTLLACLAGLDNPDGGMVSVAGHRLSRRSESERAKLRSTHIGMLFQSQNLIEHLNVRSNIRVAQRLAKSVDVPDAAELLGRLGIAHRAGAFPSELSGGESARAGLAVALANSPRILLADEPTGELDHSTQEVVLGLLRDQADAGVAIVVVTHSDTAAAWADRRIRLRDGQVVA